MRNAFTMPATAHDTRAVTTGISGLGRAVCILLLTFTAALSARAAEASYKRILIEPTSGAVTARLPLTDTSGAARVKRFDPATGLGVPIAPTKVPLDADCYLEWQISYDTTSPDHWSVVPSIQFQRDARTKYGCELSKLLSESLTIGLISRSQLTALRQELEALRSSTLEEREKLIIAPESPAPDGPRLPEGFTRHVVRTPAIQKETPHGRIEIQLKAKQRAVGYQAMIYACLPLAQWRREDGELRGPGVARSKETVLIRFDAQNAAFLLDVVRAFGMASPEHNDDLGRILDALLAP